MVPDDTRTASPSVGTLPSRAPLGPNAEPACARCGARSQGEASGPSKCALCRRHCCATCLLTDLCGTCAELAPQSDDETAQLPDALLAVGADVRSAHDPIAVGPEGGHASESTAAAGRVITIRTSHRCEVVVLVGDCIVAWHDASGLNPTEIAALFSLSALVEQAEALPGGGSIRLQLDQADPPPSNETNSSDGLAAIDRWQAGVALDVTAPGPSAAPKPLSTEGGDSFIPSGEWLASSVHHDPLDDADVLALLVATLPSVAMLPSPTPTATGLALADASTNDSVATRIDALVPQRSGNDTTVALTVTQQRSTVAIHADGLVETTGPIHRPQDQMIAWELLSGSQTTTATAAGSDDEPISWFKPALTATSSTLTARLGTVGGFRLLELDHVGQRTPERLRLDNQPGWSSVAVLNYTCELGADRLAIASYLDLDDVELTTVGNAQLTSRRITPVLRESAEPEPRDPDPGDALRSLTAGLRGVAPHLDATAAPIDASLAQALSDRLDAVTGARHRRVHVGLEVSDVWLTPHGRASFTYQRFYSDTIADDDATGTRAHSLWADRRRHLTELPLRCRYCHTDVCEACNDGITACEICSESLCLECATSEEHPGLRLCDACRSLRPARRPGAISWPEGADVDGPPLMGTDRHHRVVVAPAAGGGAWRRVIQPSGAADTESFSLEGSILTHLNVLTEAKPGDSSFRSGSPGGAATARPKDTAATQASPVS